MRSSVPARPRRRRGRMALALVLASATCAGACGYSTSTALLPTHLKTVAIPVFANATTEYSLDREITDAVIRTFVADNHLRVVDQRGADSVIRGKITSYRNSVF